MLLEEKIAIIQQLKKNSDYSSRVILTDDHLSYPYKIKDHETNDPMIFKKAVSFSFRFLFSVMIFSLLYVVKENNYLENMITFNDLQYYLTKHYFLP